MTQFWTPQNLSIKLKGADGARTWNLGQPYALLGSHAQCDVVIDDPTVSARALLLLATRHGIRGVVLSAGAKKDGRVIQVVPNQPLKLHDPEGIKFCETSKVSTRDYIS